LRLEDGKVIATSQICGGTVLVEAELTGEQGVTAVMPGAFPAAEGRAAGAPQVEKMGPPAPLEGLRTVFKRLIEPEVGDIDISQEPVLVAVGRGIEREENIKLAVELAEALGGRLCASRPIVDRGWLPMTRLVGRSGMAVKPKLYLALGISGAPEHIEGMKSAELIVAVNSDPSAPIFNVAHYGVVSDLFKVLPPLITELRGSAAGG
ncbi:MAG: electron transfer flavoprotein subunit alpha/FixB family protein, partial [Candidatus Bipolaricaulia bacterium]